MAWSGNSMRDSTRGVCTTQNSFNKSALGFNFTLSHCLEKMMEMTRHLGELDHFCGLPGVFVLTFALQRISRNRDRNTVLLLHQKTNSTCLHNSYFFKLQNDFIKTKTNRCEQKLHFWEHLYLLPLISTQQATKYIFLKVKIQEFLNSFQTDATPLKWKNLWHNYCMEKKRRLDQFKDMTEHAWVQRSRPNRMANMAPLSKVKLQDHLRECACATAVMQVPLIQNKEDEEKWRFGWKAFDSLWLNLIDCILISWDFNWMKLVCFNIRPTWHTTLKTHSHKKYVFGAFNLFLRLFFKDVI